MSNGAEANFGLSISERPEPTDEVAEKSGAKVFLDQEVAPLVDGRTLDARPVGDQKVQFAFLS